MGEVLPKDLRKKFVLVTLFDPRVKRKDMDVHLLGCGGEGAVLRSASGDRICLSEAAWIPDVISLRCLTVTLRLQTLGV